MKWLCCSKIEDLLTRSDLTVSHTTSNYTKKKLQKEIKKVFRYDSLAFIFLMYNLFLLENDWIFPSQKLNDIAHFSSTIYLRIYFYLTVKNSNKPCNNNNNDNERNVLSLKEFSIRKTREYEIHDFYLKIPFRLSAANQASTRSTSVLFERYSIFPLTKQKS